MSAAPTRLEKGRTSKTLALYVDAGPAARRRRRNTVIVKFTTSGPITDRSIKTGTRHRSRHVERVELPVALEQDAEAKGHLRVRAPRARSIAHLSASALVMPRGQRRPARLPPIRW